MDTNNMKSMYTTRIKDRSSDEMNPEVIIKD